MKKLYLSSLGLLLISSFQAMSQGTTVQTITFPTITNKYNDNPAFKLIASAQSNGPITFSITTGSGTIASLSSGGDSLIINPATTGGTVTIKADQAGDANFAPATLSKSFVVTARAQVITFPTIPAKLTNSPSFRLNATSSSKLPVSYSITSGSAFAVLSGYNLIIKGAGTVTVKATTSTADQSTIVSTAPDVTRTFTISKVAQTINFATLANKFVNAASFKLNATATSNKTVKYTVVSGPASIVGVDSNTVLLSGLAGTVVIAANQDGVSPNAYGNDVYAAAPQVTRSFNVTQATQTISWAPITSKTTTASPFLVSATTTSGLPLVLSVVSGPATISGSTVTLTGGTGVVTLRATQAGSSEYAAKVTDKSFTVYSTFYTTPLAGGSTQSTVLVDAAYSVYPNPAMAGPITISTKDEMSEVIVYDMVGKVIFHGQYEPNTYSAKLNIENKGMYFISVQAGNVTTTSRLMVIE